MIKRIKSRRGETLVEMLVSITILVLALSILSAMLAAAYNSENAAREADKAFYKKELSPAEAQTGTPEKEIVKIDGTTVHITMDVDIYSGEKGELKSYKKP